MKLLANKDLFFNNGLKNFSVQGLYSFILQNNNGLKTRLFVNVAANNIGKYLAPVHQHKYNDSIQILFGRVVDFLYEKNAQDGTICKQYKYNRLNDSFEQKLTETGKTSVLKLINVHENSHEIDYHYHTVKVYDQFSAWIIQEKSINVHFDDQDCYLLPSMETNQNNPKLVTEHDCQLVIDVLKQYNIEIEFL